MLNERNCLRLTTDRVATLNTVDFFTPRMCDPITDNVRRLTIKFALLIGVLLRLSTVMRFHSQAEL